MTRAVLLSGAACAAFVSSPAVADPHNSTLGTLASDGTRSCDVAFGGAFNCKVSDPDGIARIDVKHVHPGGKVTLEASHKVGCKKETTFKLPADGARHIVNIVDCQKPTPSLDAYRVSEDGFVRTEPHGK
jgi:hypothetical protein